AWMKTWSRRKLARSWPPFPANAKLPTSGVPSVALNECAADWNEAEPCAASSEVEAVDRSSTRFGTASSILSCISAGSAGLLEWQARTAGRRDATTRRRMGGHVGPQGDPDARAPVPQACAGRSGE